MQTGGKQPTKTTVYRKSNFQASCMEGLRIIFGDENILLLGTIQVNIYTLHINMCVYNMYVYYITHTYIYICILYPRV
jgi:hypothetical protein